MRTLPVPACPALELLDLQPFLQERGLKIIQIVMQFDKPFSTLYNAYFHERHSEAIQVQINFRTNERRKVEPTNGRKLVSIVSMSTDSRKSDIMIQITNIKWSNIFGNFPLRYGKSLQ